MQETPGSVSERHILGGAIRVAAFVLVAKIVIAAREIVMASRFGVGPVADAYNITLAVGTWLPILLAAAIGSALVPALVRADAAPEEERALFLGELDGHAILLASVTALFGLALAFVAPTLFSSGQPETDEYLRTLLLYFAPFAGLTTLFYYFSNRLQAQGRFAYTAIEAVPALFVVFVVLALSTALAPASLAAATLAGGAVQVFLLWLILRRGHVPAGPVSLTRHAPEWGMLVAGIGAMAIGQAVLSLGGPIDQFFAAQAGPGVPASFGYANRLIGIGTSIGTLILARALLPGLAAMRTRDPHGARRVTMKWAACTFALGLVGLVGVYFLAEPVTRIAFERGYFSPQDTARVASLLTLGALQLPFFFSGVAAVQWLAVEGRFVAIAAIAVATLLVKVLLLTVLVDRFGAAGLMLSTAGMYVFAWLMQMIAAAQPARDPQVVREAR
jgi:peptidoglycan biosynthesis protein MviN/MurJ (putative lipid II flippase)